MPQTMVEKIISGVVGTPCKAGDFLEKLPLTKVFLNEVIAPPAITYFQNDFAPVFEKQGKKVSVFDSRRVFFIPDHTVPSCSLKVSQGIDMMKQFAADTGIRMYKEGDGIEHVVLPEGGEIVPGDIVIGTDSHTDTNGALNCLGFGAGTTDAQLAMATGCLYNFTVPQSILFRLHGKLGPHVSGKDVILSIIAQMGAGGCSKRVAEFTGPGLASLSMDDRFTIANMCVEMSARSGIFAFDDRTKAYLDAAQPKWDYEPVRVDEDAAYDRVIDINLDEIEPMVAFPHLPSHGVPVSQCAAMIEKTKHSDDRTLARVEDDTITCAFIGSCTNGRESDLLAGAEIIKGRKVHPNVNLIVIPGSRKVYNWAMKSGILQIYADAGANIESSNCGPCFGKHMGVLGEKGKMMSSSNRNYKGRMGSKDALIFLASPATVAASAVAGRIAAPGALDEKQKGAA